MLMLELSRVLFAISSIQPYGSEFRNSGDMKSEDFLGEEIQSDTLGNVA